MSDPQISVVVPTRDRPEELGRLFEGLRSQVLAADRFEVIVVDDGSSASATQHVLAEESTRGELQLRSVRNETALGQARARNQGWREARAPLVAFTDDDCVPDPAWLDALLRASEAAASAIVQGQTEPDPLGPRRRGPFSRTVRVQSLGPQYQTCNILYPRTLLERLEGFDERVGQPVAGEDTELAWRAFEAGAQAVFAPDALVFHAVHQLGFLGALRDATRWSEAARVFALHPEARQMLSRGVFWNGWHYCLVRSVVALALPRPVRRVLLTHHAMQLAERAREAGAGPWAAPLLLAYDVVETAALVRGAVRYRTPVL
jgi:glycosyltransferase involved in cell wall biosynthesis